MFRRASRAVTSLLFASFCCWAQSHDGAQPLPLSTNEKSPLTGHLTPVETSVTGEVATGFAGPFVCDGDGNLYLGSESTGVRAIRKLNPKGELVALFDPSSNPDVQVQVTGNFSVSVDGEPHVLGFLTKGISRYVLVFKSDGTYKGNIKLDPGFPWIPASLGVFSNESLLVTGEAYDRDRNAPMLPFTGIFRADGKLLKELNLEGDDSIHDMAVAHDPRVMSTTNARSNHAIGWSQIEPAKDGNLYLMRWLSPAVFYAISPGGQVVRRFTVDPGNEDYKPIEMHISGNRIAVLFYHPQTMEKIMKIVDLEGHELAAYDELRADGKPKLGMVGLAFACYTQKPERFLFLVTGDDHRVQLRLAEGR
jgi:hypothetical protein